ncbi:MAG: efflux RND transporter permease subunit, partial [Balneolales bacterium]
MIEKLITYAIRNKLIVGLFMLAWIGWGIWSFTQLSIDAIPDITDNQVRVVTTSPTLATQEVEQFVTYPVELTMANLPGVEEMRSVSKMGLSIVTIVFEDDMGTYKPRQLVSEQLQAAREDIPEMFGSPILMPITTGLGEIYQYSLVVDDEYKDEYDITELRTIQDWIVRRQLSGVDGIVEINSTGGNVKQYEVAVNPENLRSMDLTLNDVMEALKRNNRNVGGSYVEKGPEAIFIRGEGLAENLDDLRKIVVDTQNKTPILVGDIAEVGFGHAVRYGAMTRNGEGEAVGGQALMLKGENSDAVIENVKERINEIQAS